MIIYKEIAEWFTFELKMSFSVQYFAYCFVLEIVERTRSRSKLCAGGTHEKL